MSTEHPSMSHNASRGMCRRDDLRPALLRVLGLTCTDPDSGGDHSLQGTSSLENSIVRKLPGPRLKFAMQGITRAMVYYWQRTYLHSISFPHEDVSTPSQPY